MEFNGWPLFPKARLNIAAFLKNHLNLVRFKLTLMKVAVGFHSWARNLAIFEMWRAIIHAD